MSAVYTEKRGKFWRYKFRTDELDDSSTWVTGSGYATKEEALIEGTKHKEKIEAGWLSRGTSKLTLSDYLDFWVLNVSNKTHRPNTSVRHIKNIERYIKPVLGRTLLKNLGPLRVSAFINRMEDDGTHSRTTIQDAYITLKYALKYAVTVGLIERSPCEGLVTPPAPKNVRDVVMTPEQMKAIFSRFPEGNHWHLPLMLGYLTGMRKSEVFALTWDDIDLKKRVIHVTKAAVAVKEFHSERMERHACNTSWFFFPTKTPSSVRKIRMGEELYELLMRYWEKHRVNKDFFGDRYRVMCLIEETLDNGLVGLRLYELEKGIPVNLPTVEMVITGANGHWINFNNLAYCNKIIKEELRIEGFSFHSLRHTHASILVQEGVNPKAVQTRLGHSNVLTTLNRYVHGTDAMEEDASDTFDEYLEEHELFPNLSPKGKGEEE